VDKLLDHKEASAELWHPPAYKIVESAFNGHFSIFFLF
jgi:hypothetical protein